MVTPLTQPSLISELWQGCLALLGIILFFVSLTLENHELLLVSGIATAILCCALSVSSLLVKSWKRSENEGIRFKVLPILGLVSVITIPFALPHVIYPLSATIALWILPLPYARLLSSLVLIGITAPSLILDLNSDPDVHGWMYLVIVFMCGPVLMGYTYVLTLPVKHPSETHEKE